jgi:hypothetical protein
VAQTPVLTKDLKNEKNKKKQKGKRRPFRGQMMKTCTSGE